MQDRTTVPQFCTRWRLDDRGCPSFAEIEGYFYCLRHPEHAYALLCNPPAVLVTQVHAA